MSKHWAEVLFRKFHPHYRHRWEIYHDVLCEHVSASTVWLDVGCGTNGDVAELGSVAKYAVGIDIIDNKNRTAAPFLKADLRSIPLPSSFANLITMRMVAEHLENVPRDFTEVDRLLVPGGVLVVLTTNSWSPIVVLPRLFPFPLKRWVIARLFGVPDEDVLPTFHRFNSAARMVKGVLGMRLTTIRFVEQVPLQSSFLTLVFGVWYSITTPGPLRRFRSNLLAVFSKSSDSEQS